MREHEQSSEAPDNADMVAASSDDAAWPHLDDSSSYWQRARYIVLGVVAVAGAILLMLGMLTQRRGNVHFAIPVLHVVSHHGTVLRLLAGIEP